MICVIANMKRRAKLPTRKYKTEPGISSQISRRQSLHYTRPLAESCPKDPIGILKHAIFQADYYELGTFEPSLDEAADVLGVREI